MQLRSKVFSVPHGVPERKRKASLALNSHRACAGSRTSVHNALLTQPLKVRSKTTRAGNRILHLVHSFPTISWDRECQACEGRVKRVNFWVRLFSHHLILALGMNTYNSGFQSASIEFERTHETQNTFRKTTGLGNCDSQGRS